MPKHGTCPSVFDGTSSAPHHLAMSMRAVALATLGLALTTACTDHTNSSRSATQATVLGHAAPLPCGGENVRASVGSTGAPVVLHSLERETMTARVGDTLELTSLGPCHDSVHLYEHGALIATDGIRIQLSQAGERLFEADIPMCAHRGGTCFGGLSSLGSIEVITH